MDQNEKAIHRLYKYLDYKRIKNRVFEEKAGLANGYIASQRNRSSGIGEEAFLKILDKAPDLNPIWLLKGEGSMIVEENEPNEYPISDPEFDMVEEGTAEYKSAYANLKREIKSIKAENKRLLEDRDMLRAMINDKETIIIGLREGSIPITKHKTTD